MLFNNFIKKIKQIGSVVFINTHWLYANSWQRMRLLLSLVLNLIDTAAKLLGPLALAKSVELIAESKQQDDFFGITLSPEKLLIVATTANAIHLVIPSIKKLILYGIQENFAQELSYKITEKSQKLITDTSPPSLKELFVEATRHIQSVNFESGQLLFSVTENIHPLFLDITLGIGFTFFRFDRSVGGILLGYIISSIAVNELLSSFTKITQRSQEVGIAFSNYIKDFCDTLTNSETIILLNRQNLENLNLNSAYEKYFKLNKKNSCQENFWIMQPLLACIVQYLAAYYVIRDDFQKIELDDIVFLLNYAMNIAWNINLINKSFQSAISAAENLNEINNFIAHIPLEQIVIEEDSKSTPLLANNNHAYSNSPIKINKKAEIAIEFENVSFHYTPETPILNLVSFKIPRGKTIGLVGPSGAGKTTIIKLICGMLKPSNPEAIIKIFGTDIRAIPLKQLRELVSVTKQQVSIFQENSLKYNVLYGFADDASLHKLKVSETNSLKNDAANQYDSIFHKLLKDVKLEKAANQTECQLSGGEQQRVGIARNLVRHSEIFILDEATSANDSQTEKTLSKSIKKYSTEKTRLMIAHRLLTLRDADNILVLDKRNNKGVTIIEQGTHDELLQKNDSYANLWRLQTS